MKSSALKKLTAAVASALLMTSAAHAAGLGKLTVLSALGQPLRAEIELTSAANEDAAGLAVKLASPEAFKSANIEFNPALLTLRFNVEQRGGRQVIRVNSSQPLNEPFVDMLLELNWSSGHLVREYTFLLDPAELRSTQSAQVAATAGAHRQRADAASNQASSNAAASAGAPAANADAAPARANRARPAESQAAEPAQAQQGSGASSYRVKSGETLGKIAGQIKPADVSLDMMLVALYRANPDAFIGNNMNRLKSGRVLSVPDESSVRATGETEAHNVVVAHAADFNAYRNKLAGQVAAGEAVKAPQASQSAGGKVAAKVEERPTAVNESPDRLRLSKAAPAAAAGKNASAEDVIAKQKELAEAQARLKELERNVTDLQKLSTIKSKAGAEASQKASATSQLPPVAPAPAPAAAPAATATPAAASAPAAAAPTAAAKPDEAKPAPAEPAATKLPTIKPAIKPPVQEPSLFDKIMDNLLPIGAVGLVALLGGLLVVQRRKKREAELAAGPVSILNVPSEPTHSLFAQTGGQSVDTTNNSVFNSNFAPSASQLDTNEVDPVAEADVYIAYGRDAQAEEILKEALRLHPERLPVRLKLLEIYAARKDQRAFETQAAEMYSLTRGMGEEWAQAAALGLSIDPQNPLYATSGATTLGPMPADLHDLHDPHAKEMDDAFGAAAAHEAAPFDQHFASAMGAAGAAAAAAASPAAEAHPAAQEEEHLLDFDLGGLSFEPIGEDAPPAGAKPADGHGPATQMSDLDFDMDPFAAPAAEATALPSAAAEPLPEVQAHDLDFDMDAFAPPATPAAAPAAVDLAKAEEFPFSMDFDAPHTPAAPVPAEHSVNLADLAKEFELPLPEVHEEPHPGATAEHSLDLDNLDFGADVPASYAPADHALDLPALHGEVDEPIQARPAAPNYTPPNKFAPRFDFSNREHDAPAEASQRLPEISAPAFEADHGSSDVATVELSPAQMEMETKLDLAMAYQEIGDKEGARELLDEVIKGGNVEQASRANALRATLA